MLHTALYVIRFDPFENNKKAMYGKQNDGGWRSLGRILSCLNGMRHDETPFSFLQKIIFPLTFIPLIVLLFILKWNIKVIWFINGNVTNNPNITLVM